MLSVLIEAKKLIYFRLPLDLLLILVPWVLPVLSFTVYVPQLVRGDSLSYVLNLILLWLEFVSSFGDVNGACTYYFQFGQNLFFHFAAVSCAVRGVSVAFRFVLKCLKAMTSKRSLRLGNLRKSSRVSRAFWVMGYIWWTLYHFHWSRVHMIRSNDNLWCS